MKINEITVLDNSAYPFKNIALAQITNAPSPAYDTLIGSKNKVSVHGDKTRLYLYYNDKAVGFMQLQKDKFCSNCFSIHDVYILDELQNTGIGKAFYQIVLENLPIVLTTGSQSVLVQKSHQLWVSFIKNPDYEARFFPNKKNDDWFSATTNSTVSHRAYIKDNKIVYTADGQEQDVYNKGILVLYHKNTRVPISWLSEDS